MPSIVIVGKCQNHGAPLVNFLEQLDPLEQLTLTIDDDLIPDLRFLLDSLSVTEPTNVCEVSRNLIQVVFYLPPFANQVRVRDQHSRSFQTRAEYTHGPAGLH